MILSENNYICDDCGVHVEMEFIGSPVGVPDIIFCPSCQNILDATPDREFTVAYNPETKTVIEIWSPSKDSLIAKLPAGAVVTGKQATAVLARVTGEDDIDVREIDRS